MTRTNLLVEEPVETPTEVPPVRPMSPEDELRVLEKEALKRGMTDKEFEAIQKIGTCRAQVQTRIQRLHQWLATH